MKKKTKRKYWIAAIVWLATMILANSINEYFHASPLIRGGRGINIEYLTDIRTS